MSFKYEKLSLFCFKCGKLSYTIKMCKLNKDETKELEFGAWMRANQSRMNKFVLNEKNQVDGKRKSMRLLRGVETFLKLLSITNKI